MTDADEGSQENTASSRMEAMIARMRRPAPAPSPTRVDEDRLAAAAWRAVNLPAPDTEGGQAPALHDTPVHLERGAMVGRYMVLSTLGAGGMGVVYAAYDPELDRKLALKLVAPGRGGEDGSTRLLREAQALAKLSHRSVVAVHDVGTMGEQVWLAMELVRGVMLRQWCEPRRPWRDVLAVMRKAARGLAAAHAAGCCTATSSPRT